MAVAVVTASDLKTRYPEFNGVADALITAILAEARQMVDEGWLAADQAPAQLAFAAHLLAMEGYPARAVNPGAPIPPGVGREMLSRKVGDVSVTYAQTTSVNGGTTGAGSLLAQLALTPYGRRFAQLLRLNTVTIGLV